jgi:hypothetical protein
MNLIDEMLIKMWKRMLQTKKTMADFRYIFVKPSGSIVSVSREKQPKTIAVVIKPKLVMNVILSGSKLYAFMAVPFI